MSLKINEIYNMDCLEGMKLIDDKSVDMILCDLPYGTTACKWDTIIPFEPLWEQYKRVIKDNGAIVMTAQQPFTTALINSNLTDFRYTWVWDKGYSTGFANCKKMPMKRHEDICVFYKKLPLYKPQGLKKITPKDKLRKKGGAGEVMGVNGVEGKVYSQTHTNYPNTIINTKKETTKHPTGKPVALFEYLIKTYTNEGETVLDNCMGSGTTAIACLNTNRNYIGFELDATYFDIANKRINEHHIQTNIRWG